MTLNAGLTKSAYRASIVLEPPIQIPVYAGSGLLIKRDLLRFILEKRDMLLYQTCGWSVVCKFKGRYTCKCLGVFAVQYQTGKLVLPSRKVP